MSNLNRIRGARFVNEAILEQTGIPGTLPASNDLAYFNIDLAGQPRLASIDSASNLIIYGPNAIAGGAFLEPVLNIQVDNTLDPGASPATGDAYIVTDIGNINPNFILDAGVEDNDRVAWDGAKFVTTFDASTAVSDKCTLNRNDGHTWCYIVSLGSWEDFGQAQSEVTVGATIGQFEELNLAVAAGFTQIKVIADTTESADTELTSSVICSFISDSTINFGEFSVDFNANDLSFSCFGQGELSFLHTSNNDCFQAGGNTGLFLDIEGVKVTNKSTVNGCEIVSSNEITTKYRNSTCDLPNIDSGGFNLLNAQSQVVGIRFLGGGNLCNNVLNLFDATFDDCTFEGTYTSGGEAINSAETNLGRMNRITVNTTGTFRVAVSGSLTDLRTVSANAVKIRITRDNAIVSKCVIGAEDVDLDGHSNCEIDNVTSSGRLNLSDAGSVDNKITNCEFDSIGESGGEDTLPSDRNQIINTTIASGFSVTGSRNQFSTMNFTAAAGTITFASTATLNAATNIISDALIVDTSTAQNNEWSINPVF